MSDKRAKSSAQSKELLERALKSVGFDAANPDPYAIWTAYQTFASIPFDCASDDLLWQAGLFAFTGQPMYHWDITRQFIFETDGEQDPMTQLNLTLLFLPDTRFDGLRDTLWSIDVPGDSAAFFAAVAQRPAFRLPIELCRPADYRLNYGEV